MGREGPCLALSRGVKLVSPSVSEASYVLSGIIRHESDEKTIWVLFKISV